VTTRSRAVAALALAGALSLGACGGGDVIDMQGDPVSGEAIARTEPSPPCGSCHTLEAAEWEGDVAPNLDELRPGYRRVYDAVRSGPGAMPGYEDQLSEAELHHIAAYVSEAVAGEAPPMPGDEPEGELGGEADAD
jgi:mono/diheme cytochrome c family protein